MDSSTLTMIHDYLSPIHHQVCRVDVVVEVGWNVLSYRVVLIWFLALYCGYLSFLGVIFCLLFHSLS